MVVAFRAASWTRLSDTGDELLNKTESRVYSFSSSSPDATEQIVASFYLALALDPFDLGIRTRLSDIVSHEYVSIEGSQSISSICNIKSVKHCIAYDAVLLRQSFAFCFKSNFWAADDIKEIQALFAAAASFAYPSTTAVGGDNVCASTVHSISMTQQTMKKPLSGRP